MTSERSSLTKKQIDGKRTLYALVGPTAVGKSAVASAIAGQLGAEIISTDSMQVYRGMDIGTSKPGFAEINEIRYHLIDIVGPEEEFSAARYKACADEAMEGILSRGVKPLLVGGSGLYFRAVVDDLDFSGLRTTAAGRAGLDIEFNVLDNFELHQVLAGLDPGAAGSIDVQNRRRILRAIDIARSGDHPISERQASWEGFKSPYILKAAGLEMDRNLLYRLIEQRVEKMISGGFVDEVRALAEAGKLAQGTTAGEAIGYKQITGSLAGEISLDEAIALIKKKTRNYAKRQVTWFKKDHRIKWFTIEGKPGDHMDAIRNYTSETAREVLEYMIS